MHTVYTAAATHKPYKKTLTSSVNADARHMYGRCDADSVALTPVDVEVVIGGSSGAWQH